MKHHAFMFLVLLLFVIVAWTNRNLAKKDKSP